MSAPQTDLTSEVRALREAVLALAAEQQRLRDLAHVLLAELRGRAGEAASTAGPPEQLVTLDQMAAIVGRKKRSMERYRGRLPAPRVFGRRGQGHLWAWAEVRPSLARLFGRGDLPDVFPG